MRKKLTNIVCRIHFYFDRCTMYLVFVDICIFFFTVFFFKWICSLINNGNRKTHLYICSYQRFQLVNPHTNFQLEYLSRECTIRQITTSEFSLREKLHNWFRAVHKSFRPSIHQPKISVSFILTHCACFVFSFRLGRGQPNQFKILPYHLSRPLIHNLHRNKNK